MTNRWCYRRQITKRRKKNCESRRQQCPWYIRWAVRGVAVIQWNSIYEDFRLTKSTISLCIRRVNKAIEFIHPKTVSITISGHSVPQCSAGAAGATWSGKCNYRITRRHLNKLDFFLSLSLPSNTDEIEMAEIRIPSDSRRCHAMGIVSLAINMLEHCFLLVVVDDNKHEK